MREPRDSLILSHIEKDGNNGNNGNKSYKIYISMS